jgi:hypothetical protein
MENVADVLLIENHLIYNSICNKLWMLFVCLIYLYKTQAYHRNLNIAAQ